MLTLNICISLHVFVVCRASDYVFDCMIAHVAMRLVFLDFGVHEISSTTQGLSTTLAKGERRMSQRLSLLEAEPTLSF